MQRGLHYSSNLLTMKKAVPVIIIIVLFFASFLQLKAGSLIAKPVIIDKKGEPRITLKEVVVLESQANYKMNIYAVVNNIDILDGDREFKISSQVDLSKSLANWIEILNSRSPSRMSMLLTTA